MKKNVRCIVKRGNLQESEHKIHSVVIDENHDIIFESGEIKEQYCLRSTLKPFQCAASLSLGTDKKYRFTNKEIAITCASHHAEEEHIRTVQSILKKINLKESNLECGFHFPLNKKTKSKLHAKELNKSNIYNNCSGKHSGLLALMKNMDMNTRGYINHSHPIHKYVNDYIQKEAKVTSKYFAIDGCSLPTPYFNLQTLAELYLKLITAPKSSELYKVFNAMTKHPEMVSGTKGFDTFFMKQFKNIAVSKGGAEGMQAIAMHTKKHGYISLALKVSDGNHRGNYIACINILKYLNVIKPQEEKSLLNFIGEKQINLNSIEVGKLVCEISN